MSSKDGKKWEFIEPENLLKNPLKNVEEKKTLAQDINHVLKKRKEFTSRSQLQWNKESLWPLSMQLWDFFFFYFIYFKKCILLFVLLRSRWFFSFKSNVHNSLLMGIGMSVNIRKMYPRGQLNRFFLFLNRNIKNIKNSTSEYKNRVVERFNITSTHARVL